MRCHANWLRQAKPKLDSARWDIQGGFYENACFSAQQTGELSWKAVLESLVRIERTPTGWRLRLSARVE